MAKNSFIIFTDYMRHLKLLNMEQRGVLITALTCYQLGEELPDMDDVTLMAFSFIAQDMDNNNAKYDKVCKARSEAGKKGGRPKKANALEEKQTKAKKPKGFSEKQTKAKKADNDNDNDNENDNDNDNNIYISGKPDASTKKLSFEDAYKVMDLYNSICHMMPKCTHYTDKRVKAINTRLKKYTIADFEKVFTVASESEFLTTKWKCNIDWLINENNMIKVLEGNYTDKKKPGNKFINFDQRQYSNDLEKQFLGIK